VLSRPAEVGTVARIVRKHCMVLSVDRGVGRAEVEPATLCLEAPVSGITAERGKAQNEGPANEHQAMFPGGLGMPHRGLAGWVGWGPGVPRLP
jgi:hypothetical protein